MVGDSKYGTLYEIFIPVFSSPQNSGILRYSD